MTLYIKDGLTSMSWTTPGSQLVAEHWSTYKSHWTHERNYSTSHIKHFGLVLPSSNPTGRKCPTYPLRWPGTFKNSPLLKKALRYCNVLQGGEQLAGLCCTASTCGSETRLRWWGTGPAWWSLFFEGLKRDSK